MFIQLDMFEVGLGAAILLQFKTGAGYVRVLADAGATDYPSDHVYNKLPGVISDLTSDELRIDLIIGTHYDADHLEGLVPIINDTRISIGEAWLPPVANDTEPKAREDRPLDGRLLALQFASEGGDEVLFKYLKEKEKLCRELADAEHLADEKPGADRQSSSRRIFTDRYNDRYRRSDAEPDISIFQEHILDANVTLGAGVAFGHADESVFDFDFPSDGAIDDFWPVVRSPAELYAALNRVGRVEAGLQSLAYIRRSSASDAINANSLAKVVKALKARNIPIRCATIEDGQPRRFVWSSKAGRFIPFQKADKGAPELTLMAPSEALVKKHWDRLPIGDYMKRIYLAGLPVKSITPSNQLSYVMRFNFSGQNILITGDAGFVDFKKGRSGDYYSPLLQSLSPLHVVQVAHHGGANGHFYHGLLASDFPKQNEKCYLLLSHDVDDKHRPSELFGKFVEQVRTQDDNLGVLFTSRPQGKFVRDFLDLVEPVVGSPSADRGDVQLQYSGDGWRVTKHAVQV